jgi:2'-hydroxyisoflavone reductase
MRLLLLGGTKFLGRAIAEAAVETGHELTLFNRGQTNPELFPQAEKLRGDRERDLSKLAGRDWDAVLDTSGYVPHVVRASAEALAESGRYCFVSSVSVYASFSGPVDEESPLAPLGDHAIDRVTPEYENYGALKALCEGVVEETFGRRALIVRPGLITGPHDPTGRFTYWPHRLARGGDVLAPGPAEQTVQFIDVRDLAAWIVNLCERRVAGTFNATSRGVSWEELLTTCRTVTSSDARLVWVPGDFLAERGVGEWMELPLWIYDPEWAGLHQADVSRALAAGLEFRPLEEAVRGAWAEAGPTQNAGLAPEREAALLAAWHGR